MTTATITTMPRQPPVTITATTMNTGTIMPIITTNRCRKTSAR